MTSDIFYIGSAVDLYLRLHQHMRGHTSNSNIYLQNAIRKYGIENFEYIVIEFITDTSLLIAAEQRYLDMILPDSRYNFNPTADSRLGPSHSAETKAAISDSRKGKTHSAESNAQNLINQPNRITVYVYDAANILVGEFPSQSAVARFLGCTQQNVSRILDTFC